MNINLSIIYEAIYKQVSKCRLNNDLTLDINKIVRYSVNMTHLDGYALYTVASVDLKQFLAFGNVRPFICYDGLSIETTDVSYLVLNSEADILDVENTIRELFIYYENWKDRLLKNIIQKQPLNYILKICSEILVNPFAVVDGFSTVIGIGGTPPENPDIVWESVLNNGYSGLHLTNQNLNEAMKRKDPALDYFDDGKQVAAFCTLNISDIPSIMIGTTEVNGPLTIGQLSLMKIIQNQLNETNFLSYLDTFSAMKYGFVVERMMNGYPIEKGTIESFLRQWHAKAEDDFQLMIFYNTELADKPLQDWKRISTRIGEHLANAFIFRFETFIAALSKGKITSEEEENLKPYLTKKKIECAISDVFSPFGYLRYAYLQCKGLLAMQSDFTRIKHFDLLYMNYIISCLENSVSLKSVCDPRLLSLVGHKDALSFIDIIRTYLFSGKNMSESAKKLYMHRNTFIYKLDKISETLNLDFDSLDDVAIFRLLLSCSILEKKIMKP